MAVYRGPVPSARRRWRRRAAVGGWRHKGGLPRPSATAQAALEAASRRERAAAMRREILQMDLGQPDGVNVADELARDRSVLVRNLRQAPARCGSGSGTPSRCTGLAEACSRATLTG